MKEIKAVRHTDGAVYLHLEGLLEAIRECADATSVLPSTRDGLHGVADGLAILCARPDLVKGKP